MDKKILFVTESEFIGKVSRNNINCRTDLAWMASLNADHLPLFLIGKNYIGELYDLIILIIPKKIYKIDMFKNKLKLLKDLINPNNGKFAIMQEGPQWYFQDYTIQDQFKYYNILLQADFLLCHNDVDVYYYAGLTGKPSYVFQSVMIEDTINNLKDIKRKNVIIGGNMTSWYGGFDSYVVAREFECNITAPTMGRMQNEENNISDLTHLPYLNWTQWITELNKFKYGVHLMRTHAAGTFSLNCSFLGIPCIGYYGLDTQQILHPSTTVNVGDITAARNIANALKNDNKFYEECVSETKMLYNMFYTEEVFIKQFEKILESEKI